jgi:hypothetical protein
MAPGLAFDAGLGDADGRAGDAVWRGFAAGELVGRSAEEVFDEGDCLGCSLEAFACGPRDAAWVWPAVTRPAASAGAGEAGPCAVAATTTAPAAATAGATSAARLTTLFTCRGLACRAPAGACRPAFLPFACLP